MSFAVERLLVRATVSDTQPEAIGRSRVSAQLQSLKERVPQAIARLGAKEWRKRVDALTGHTTPPHAINRAYSKMREIMLTCALPCPRHSLHLGEAPGGFVQALADIVEHRGLKEQWRWTAVSLSDGPAFALDRLPTARGQAVLHDLRSWQPEDPQARYELVTGDAAVEMDHARIEQEHVSLLDAEAALACRYCAVGGDVILKFYEGGEASTLRVLAAVTRCFESCTVIKPFTSRAVNSERYLIGRRRLERESYDSAPYPAPIWCEDTHSVLDELNSDQIQSLQKIFAKVP